MAEYTIRLKDVCNLYGKANVENWFTNYLLEDYLTPSQIETIERAGIWNKQKLAHKIVNHYYMREIGFETVSLFKFQAQTFMEELMEDYLPVIYSNSIEYDPLVNVDFKEEFEREIEGSAENNGTSNSNSSSNSEGLGINNNTPQTNITKQNLESGIYASSVNQSEATSNVIDETRTNNNGTSNSKEKYTRTQKGNSGTLTTAQALIKQYRDTIRAVDREIINEVGSLFMSIY